MSYYEEAKALFPYTQKMRRDFHVHPEIGFQEVRTAGIVANELRDLGLEVTTGIAETGVVAIVEGNRPGPVVLLRFDMDALPIDEETQAEYASTTSGVMHACGHDGHTAVGLTVAKMLVDHKEDISGTIKLVFQPAEEGLGGAKRMVDEGVLENPRPDYSMAMHVWNEMPIGEIGIMAGPVMAGAEMFSITITGKGAHGAAPHLGHDPILAASQIISALQSIVSRNVNPLDTAVVSITAIHGGTAFNIIPPKVELKGTVRTFSDAVRENVHKRIREIVTGVANSLECEAEINVTEVSRPVVNNEKMTALVMEMVEDVLPESTSIRGVQTMGSEDMAYMMTDIPGCFIFVGSKNEGQDLVFGHHHPKFDFDEQALVNGAALITASALELLNAS